MQSRPNTLAPRPSSRKQRRANQVDYRKLFRKRQLFRASMESKPLFDRCQLPHAESRRLHLPFRTRTRQWDSDRGLQVESHPSTSDHTSAKLEQHPKPTRSMQTSLSMLWHRRQGPTSTKFATILSLQRFYQTAMANNWACQKWSHQPTRRRLPSTKTYPRSFDWHSKWV